MALRKAREKEMKFFKHKRNDNAYDENDWSYRTIDNAEEERITLHDGLE